MSTPNVEHAPARFPLVLSAVLVCLPARADNSSSADDTVATVAASSSTAAPATTAAPTSTDAPTTTVEVTTTDAAAEASRSGGRVGAARTRSSLMPEGFTNSIVLLKVSWSAKGCSSAPAPPRESPWRIEGDWAFHLSSSELGEGLFAVQNWDGLNTPTGFDGTGEVIGVSGGFTDLIGTFSATSGSGNEGTYVVELQPAAPSPEPSEATETVSIEVNDTSVAAWTTCDPVTLMCTAQSAFGGGTTMTGDIVGESGWTGNISSEQTISINVGTLDGTGDGVFITVAPLNGAETYTVPVELRCLRAFAGLAGVGTSTVTTRDVMGALAPTSVSTFELSR